MSYSQPYRPRPRRPERTPSTNDAIPFPPSAPAAGFSSQALPQPRLPFTPDYTRPGSSGSQRSQTRGAPAPAPYHYSSRPGTSSSQRQGFHQPSAASSPRPNFGPASASPHRPDFRPGTSSSSRPGTASSSRGPPPFSPVGHAPIASHDVTPSPLHQATLPSNLHDIPLSATAPPPTDPSPNRPPTLPPPPANLPPPTTRSRFSDASEHDAAVRAATSSLLAKDRWPRLAQWTLLPLILVLSGAVAILMGHSLSLYGGLKIGGTVDNTVSTHAVWPSGINLLPTWLLLACGFASFCSSIVVWGFALRARFMKPVKRLAATRVGLGIFFVGGWLASLVVYKLFETGEGGDSLGRWACDHKADGVVGAFEIGRVCTEQSVGFGLAITSVILEIALIVCFAMRTVMEKKAGTSDYLSEKSAGKIGV